MKKHFEKSIITLEQISKVLALLLCGGLLIASSMIVFDLFKELFSKDLKDAIQNGLFVLILLEMFYVIRSYVKYGSINIGLVVNIGVIATAKEIIFQLESLTLQTSLGFAIIMLSLAITYLIESMHFRMKTKGVAET